MCREGAFSILNSVPLKLIDNFTYLGSSVLSTESNVSIRLTKVLTAIDRLKIIWKSDLSDKIKRYLFQAAIHGRYEKKHEGNCPIMLRVLLNKS